MGMNQSTEQPVQDTAFLQYIVASGPPALVFRAGDFGVVFASTAVGRELGYTVQSLQGLTLADLVTEEERERLQYELRTIPVLATDQQNYVYYFRHAQTGAPRCYHMHLSPVGNVVGAPEAYYALLIPESSQLPLPYMSFHSRALSLERFIDTGFGCFEWILDEDRVYWSDGIYRIYEREKDTTPLSRTITRTYTHPGDQEAAAAFIEKVIGGAESTIETRIITTRQQEKTISVTARVVKDNAGKPFKLVGTVKDITHQRAIEEDLKRHVNELHHSNRELEEFAYIASHDMQEPLRKVSTFGNLLVEKYRDVLNDEGKSYVDRMTRSADNMKVLINNILEFSRVSRDTEQFAPVNLDLVVQEVKSDLNIMIQETGSEVVADKLPSIEGNFTQLKQLFSNLLSNAIKFQAKTVKPEIHITCRPALPKELSAYGLPAKQAYYHIAVSDNGIGFEQEYAQQIFKLFHRLNGKSAFPGSGLGLAICQRIADRHHGTIYAESSPGKGATFVILLPEHSPKMHAAL
jgi:signal transduction histidine kinase